MDGAIILASDGTRVARANVHLVPDPDIPTSETGTRHRTAERVGRQIAVPVITVSEEMGVVSIHYQGNKQTLEPIPRVLARADQALQILGRYKTRLDGVTGALSALEVEDLVTVRDVVTVLQRAEMVRRIADEIEGYVVELGLDGRLVELQLEELTGGVLEDMRLVCKDYFVESPEWVLAQVTARLVRDLRRRAARPARRRRAAAPPGRPRPRLVAATARLPAAQSKIPRLPETIAEHVVDRFGTLPKIMRAASPTSSRSKASARRGRARSRTVSRASRRRRSSTGTRNVRSHGCTERGNESTTSQSNRARSSSTVLEVAAVHARPDGVPVAGVVLHPDIGGLAPAVRGHGPAARDARPRRVRRASRSRSSLKRCGHRSRSEWRTWPTSTTTSRWRCSKRPRTCSWSTTT